MSYALLGWRGGEVNVVTINYYPIWLSRDKVIPSKKIIVCLQSIPIYLPHSFIVLRHQVIKVWLLNISSSLVIRNSGEEYLHLVYCSSPACLCFVFPRILAPRFMSALGTTRLFANVLNYSCFGHFWKYNYVLTSVTGDGQRSVERDKNARKIVRWWSTMTLTVARNQAARGQTVFRYLTTLTTGTSHGHVKGSLTSSINVSCLHACSCSSRPGSGWTASSGNLSLAPE